MFERTAENKTGIWQEKAADYVSKLVGEKEQ
jgi:hypothetical protein